MAYSKTFMTFAGFALMAGPAVADLRVSFQESAPKDRFVIENTGSCPTAALDLGIELEGTRGGLIFDTASGGVGVEVFQPLELASGGHLVRGLGAMADGDRRLDVSLAPLAPGDRVVLTVDVDDTLRASEWGQIRVSGAEIAGGRVVGGDRPGVFDDKASATVALSPCVS